MVRFIEQFEREAAHGGLYRRNLGKAELSFLENVWGPSFQYHYEGLKAEYPLKDFKGGQRFADFVYVKDGMKLLLEIDGFTTHARDISPGEFDDHLMRQNDLILSGWLVLRFSANQVEKRPHICQRQLKQAFGHWWSMSLSSLPADESGVWHLRKAALVQMAVRNRDVLKPADVAKQFNVSGRTAAIWLRRFEQEGLFTAVSGKSRVTAYALTGGANKSGS
jgi:hypothetical protein